MLFIDHYKGKRVLITGNTGFKGAWLSLYLKYLGAELIGLSKPQEFKKSMYNTCKVETFTNQYYYDIIDYESVRKVIHETNPEIIFHLAAQSITLTAYKKPLSTFQTNSIGTANVLEALRTNEKECSAVIVTSDKCYRNNEWMQGYTETDVLEGVDPYSASKSVAEIISKSYYQSFFKDSGKIRISTCRAGNVIGGGDWNDYRIIPDCIRAWMDQQTLPIRNPKAIRPWNYVLDVLTGYLTTAYHLEHTSINGEAFNFGPNAECEISVHQLVKILWTSWNASNFEPYQISKNPPEFFEHTYLKLNSQKARTMLNWKPQTNIKTGLQATAQWYRQVLENPDSAYGYSMSCIEQYIERLS